MSTLFWIWRIVIKNKFTYIFTISLLLLETLTYISSTVLQKAYR